MDIPVNIDRITATRTVVEAIYILGEHPDVLEF